MCIYLPTCTSVSVCVCVNCDIVVEDGLGVVVVWLYRMGD